MKRKALVTGGAGFIGSTLVRQLLADDWDVTVFDDLSSGYAHNLKAVQSDIRFLHDTILNTSLLEEAASGADTLFHLAAQVSVPESIDDPLRNHAINATGTLNVLEAARRQGVRRVVSAASCAIYGSEPTLPKTEDMPPQPLSPYAVTKMLTELYSACYATTMGVEAVALRFFNVYGPRQDPQGGYAAAIPVFIDQFLAGNAPVIHGDGLQTRDFIFVSDVARAIRAAADSVEASGETINVGTGVETSILDIVRAIRAQVDPAIEPTFGDGRRGDVQRSVGSVKKMHRLLGDPGCVSLEEGLRETIAWYRGAR